MRATTGLIQDAVTKLTTQLHSFFKNIVQRPETQHDVLYWIGLCLHLNHQRQKVSIEEKQNLKFRFKSQKV